MFDQSSIEPIKKYGKVVYFLGTSNMGETFIPKKIRSITQAINLFGNEGSIVEGVKQVNHYIDDIDLYCIKITGNHAQASLNVNRFKGEIFEDGLFFQSKESNEIFNEIKIEIDHNLIYFHFPESFNEDGIYYLFDEYPTIGMLVNQINRDTKEGKNYVYVNSKVDNLIPTITALEGVNPNMTNFSGGYNGLDSNKNQKFIRLKETLSLIDSIPIDVIVPLEMFIDDVHPKYIYGEDYYGEAATYTEERDYLDLVNFFNQQLHYHQPLLDFCNHQKRHGLNTHVVMGMNSFKDFDDADYIEKLIQQTPIANKISIPDNKTASYLSVFAGDVEFNETINNGYLQYACLMASTITLENTTNKPFRGDIKPVQYFDNEALELLASLGATTMRYSELKQSTVVHNGVTLANETSPLHFVVNVRMIQIVLGQIKLALEKHIGKIVSILDSEGTIKKELDSLLDGMKDNDILKNYDYDLQFLEGELLIKVKLETVYMIESIEDKFSFAYKSGE